MTQGYTDVATGEVVCVTSADHILSSLAIGSCIVVMAYDYAGHIGAMAHIMLPGIAPVASDDKYRYSNNAIDHLLELLEKAGWSKAYTVFTLVGAGNVLMDEKDTICQSNIDAVKSRFASLEITISACVLGGYQRKAAFLDTSSGKMLYSIGGGEKITLWPKSAR